MASALGDLDSDSGESAGVEHRLEDPHIPLLKEQYGIKEKRYEETIEKRREKKRQEGQQQDHEKGR